MQSMLRPLSLLFLLFCNYCFLIDQFKILIPNNFAAAELEDNAEFACGRTHEEATKEALHVRSKSYTAEFVQIQIRFFLEKQIVRP